MLFKTLPTIIYAPQFYRLSGVLLADTLLTSFARTAAVSKEEVLNCCEP